MARKLLWSIERRGVFETLKTLTKFRLVSDSRRAAKEAVHPFDLKHGVETSGLVDGVDLFTGHKHDAFNTAYWGVSPSRARVILRRWAESLTEKNSGDYTFIDVGCGKGRMLLIASEFGFQQVIGVELNGALAASAIANVERWQAPGKPGPKLTVLQQDATEIIRPTGPCLFFLYNPFGAVVLKKLLDRLEADKSAKPGETDFIYLHSEFDEVFVAREDYSAVWSGHVPQSEDEHRDDVEDVVAAGFQSCKIYRR